MILFNSDWDKYPTATIHTETTNTSFIELAKLYRDMGIKNNAFHLALVNPHLRNINPHDYKNLSDRDVAAIAIECKINPWYYMREILRAPPEGGLYPRMVTANRSNIALWWLFLNHIDLYLIQPRQTGKSFNTDGLMTWLLMIYCDNTKIKLITKDQKLRQTNISRLKNIMEYLPPYLDMRTRNDANNSEAITVNAKNNSYNTYVSQASAAAAEKIGRGDTVPILHVDEAAYIQNASTTMQAALPSMNAAKAIAKANDTPYGVIYTTTAGRKDSPNGKYMYQGLMESMVYDERLLFDVANREELEAVIRKNSKADRRIHPNGVCRMNCTFSHRQLGYTDEWLRETMESNQAFGDNANRDFFNIWTSGNERSPISVQDAEAIAMSRVERPFESLVDGYVLRWYVGDDDATIDAYMNDHDTIMGIDTSDASGGDDIGLVITDAKSASIVAGANYNYTNVHKFGRFILAILLKYPRLTVVIESRSTGSGILQHLLVALPANGLNPFKRLFNRVVQEREDSPAHQESYDECMRYGKREDVINKYKKYFGYPTSGMGTYSREALYGNVFRKAISISRDKIRDMSLADQILGLVIKNNRIDHDDYGHDDMVIAWLLTQWLLSEGKNLSAYGIDISGIYTSAAPEKPVSYEEYIQKVEQRQIRYQIAKLFEELESTKDIYLSIKIEQQLRMLNNKLILEDNEIFSLEQLIQDAKDKRKSNRLVYN